MVARIVPFLSCTTSHVNNIQLFLALDTKDTQFFVAGSKSLQHWHKHCIVLPTALLALNYSPLGQSVNYEYNDQKRHCQVQNIPVGLCNPALRFCSGPEHQEGRNLCTDYTMGLSVQRW